MANMTSSHPASQVAAELASAPPDQIEGLLERYRDDPRAQVRKACERARRRLDRERAERIDAIGMARSLREAVAGAVADTGLAPDCVLMDGNPLGAVPNERDVVHGDATVACIAAASIVAKVTRDELMVELDAEYPGYHLARSKGYASPEHIQAIRERGLTPVHRVSFCGNFLETARLF